MNRHLPILALLALSFPLSAFAQSLGEVARETRAERLKSGVPPARVLTNDDIAREPHSPSDNADAPLPSDAKDAKPSSSAPEARELETQRRTAEINRRYMERIAALRSQINTANLDLAKFQQDQIDIANEYRRESGPDASAPGAYEYYIKQMNACINSIAALNELITNLNAQLADLQEEARHAGVPHALD